MKVASPRQEDITVDESSTSTGRSSNRLRRIRRMIGKSRPRRRIKLISAEVLPSRPFLPQSTTMQRSRHRSAPPSPRPPACGANDLEAGALDLLDDLVEADAFEIVGVEHRCGEQEVEALEIVHVRSECARPTGLDTFDDSWMTEAPSRSGRVG